MGLACRYPLVPVPCPGSCARPASSAAQGTSAPLKALYLLLAISFKCLHLSTPDGTIEWFREFPALRASWAGPEEAPAGAGTEFRVGICPEPEIGRARSAGIEKTTPKCPS